MINVLLLKQLILLIRLVGIWIMYAKKALYSFNLMVTLIKSCNKKYFYLNMYSINFQLKTLSLIRLVVRQNGSNINLFLTILK